MSTYPQYYKISELGIFIKHAKADLIFRVQAIATKSGGFIHKQTKEVVAEAELKALLKACEPSTYSEYRNAMIGYLSQVKVIRDAFEKSL